MAACHAAAAENFYARFWNKWTIKDMTVVIIFFHNYVDDDMTSYFSVIK